MYDLVVRNGWIVDGTGAAPWIGDIAVSDGRIVFVGGSSDVTGPGGLDSPSDIALAGLTEIDASGCWVTPGFIDPHTHLDAQLCWDASGSPSRHHGVTTVVIGLCGFGVAPCGPDGGDYLLRALEVVEEIPFASTRLGVPFEWTSWREYRDFLARQALGVNVAGYVPHSALRHAVMGDRARSQVASASDRDAMADELRDAIEAGAVGFATSRGPNHVDAFGGPMPSRLADDAELSALVDVCRGRLWQVNVETKFSADATALTEEVERYAQWSEESGARLTWTPFYAEPDTTVWQDVLAHNSGLNDRGIGVFPQIAAVPITLLLRFDERSVFSVISGWREVLKGFFELTPEDKKRRLMDPVVRATMKVGGGDPREPLTPIFANWVFVRAPSRQSLSGRTLEEIAREDGAHPVDVLCDQIIADEFETLIDVPIFNKSTEGIVRFLEDDHTLLGLGDSGAHVMSVTNYRYPTFLLSELVRRRGLISIERAIQQMTEMPAQLHGLVDRGRLAPGLAADLCIIDPEHIALRPVEVVHDLPGGAPRLVQKATGFRGVFVNGVRTIADDEPTGDRPGEMLAAAPPEMLTHRVRVEG